MIVGTWNMTAYAVDNNQNLIMDAAEVEVLQDTQAIITIKSNGTFIYDLYSTNGLFDTITGTWTLTNDGTVLQTQSDGNTGSTVIDKLTSSTLVIIGSAFGKKTWETYSKI